MPPGKGGIGWGQDYLLLFSHFWFATPQEVLQADWQEVWHSPQPPFLALSHRLRVSRVLILSIVYTLHSWAGPLAEGGIIFVVSIAQNPVKVKKIPRYAPSSPSCARRMTDTSKAVRSSSLPSTTFL